MAVFGIKLFYDEISLKYLEETNERLQDNNFIKNPFKGGVHIGAKHTIIDMTPIYPNISWLAIFIIAPIFIFGWSYWWLLLTIPFFLVAFLYSKYGMFCGCYLGLKKHGYKHKITLLNDSDLIRGLL